MPFTSILTRSFFLVILASVNLIPPFFITQPAWRTCPPSSIIYVGDKLTRDILGARRAGYRLAVQIKHPYDDGDPDIGPQPDVLIHNMLELLPLLEKELEKDKVVSSRSNGHKVKALFFDAGDILYYRPIKEQKLKEFLQTQKLSPHTEPGSRNKTSS